MHCFNINMRRILMYKKTNLSWKEKLKLKFLLKAQE